MLTLALTRTNPKSPLGPSLSNWLFPPPLELPCLGRRLPSCPSLPYLLSFHTPSLLLGFSNIALGVGLGGLEKIMGDELRPASKLWVGPIPKANIGLCFLGLTSPGWHSIRSFTCWLNFTQKLTFFELFLALSFLGNASFCLINCPLWSCKLREWDFLFSFFPILLSHSGDRLVGLYLRELGRLARYQKWLPILHLVSRLLPSYHYPISILIRFVLWFTINGRNGLWGLRSWSLAYWSFLLWLSYKI